MRLTRTDCSKRGDQKVMRDLCVIDAKKRNKFTPRQMARVQKLAAAPLKQPHGRQAVGRRVAEGSLDHFSVEDVASLDPNECRG